MSLDYSPEVLRQHAAHKERRERLFQRPIAVPKPIEPPVVVTVPVVEKPVDPLPKFKSFDGRDWLSVGPACSVGAIVKEVCQQFDVRRIDILSKRRTQNIVAPRQIAMLLCKHLTMRSLPDIGRRMGERDHTTVLHACRKWRPVLEKVTARLTPGSSVGEWVKACREEMVTTPSAQSPKYTKKADR